MAKGTEKQTYKLNAESIDIISGQVFSFCEKMKSDHKTAVRYRLAAEESLAKWMDCGNMGEEMTVTVEMGRRLHMLYSLLSSVFLRRL